jgi:hypothetical protein
MRYTAGVKPRSIGLVAAISCCAALPAPAFGQTALPGQLGGGSVGTEALTASFSNVAPGEWAFRLNTTATCPGHIRPGLVLSGRFALGSDGPFSYTGKVKAPQLASNAHLHGRFKLMGTMTTGATATGTVSGRITLRYRKSSGKCRLFGGQWAVRAVGHPAGSPLTAPLSAPLFGTTSSQARPAYSVVVHPLKGRKVFVVWMTDVSCSRPARPFPFGNFTPALKVDARGRFQVHERFSVRFVDGVTRFRADTAGQLLSDGAVGTIRLRETLYKFGRTINHCDSPRLTWTAVP